MPGSARALWLLAVLSALGTPAFHAAGSAVNSSSPQAAPAPAPVAPAPPPSCSTFSRDCGGCYVAGCRFCEVGPQAWYPGLAGDARSAQGQFLDYTCSVFRCEDLTLYRPGTQYSRTVPVDRCGDALWPTTTPVTTSTTTVDPLVDGANWAQLSNVATPQEDSSDIFFASWSATHWLAITIPTAILITTLAFLWYRRNRRCCCNRKRSKVHVAPRSSQGGNSLIWDFSDIGPVDQSDIDAAEEALTEAEYEEALPQGNVSAARSAQRCIVLGSGNVLQQSHLKRLGELLDRHPTVSLNLPADWQNADDGTLFALASLLKRRGRCNLQAKIEGEGCPLLLPLGVNVGSIVAVSLSLAAGSHAEVDTLVCEVPKGSPGAGDRVTVDLNPLRQSYQEVFLTRQPLGDLGCGAACAFVGSWAGRLHAIKLRECDIGDAGAAAVGRLLSGGPTGGGTTNLRELSLSANRIGDKGITSIANALSTCDSLERLILDRNRIGPNGAKALALKLPRSNVKELVLGSHLGGNPLGPQGAESIAGALDDRLQRAAANRDTRLTAMALEDCNIQERGAAAIAAMLPKSQLMVLSVARSQLGDAGAQVVLDALPPHFMSLDLAGNSIGDQMSSKVGDVLYKFPKMAVSLAQNPISPAFREVLSQEHGRRLRV